MRIGLFGGTFDPPHLGHLIPVSAAAQEYALDQVLFMPAYVPPHKVQDHITDPYHRAAMIALSIQNYPKFLFFPLELSRGKVAFTVDTITELNSRISKSDKILFIMGSDSFLEIEQWHQYLRLIRLCEFIIINRGTGEKELKDKLDYLERKLQNAETESVPFDLNNTFHFASAPFLPVSSTDLRASIQRGLSIHGLVTQEVENYIQKHGLYRRR
jgi:nicotinate-nucleotide adenylyltransferase